MNRKFEKYIYYRELRALAGVSGECNLASKTKKAVFNIKICSTVFREIFSRGRFANLVTSGAHVTATTADLTAINLSQSPARDDDDGGKPVTTKKASSLSL